MAENLSGKLESIKAGLMTLTELALKKLNPRKSSITTETYENDYDHNYADDLPLTMNRDSSPGVAYYATENSPLAVGAEKVVAAGIDKFGDEDDIFEEEARIQNSELSERFYAPGLDIKDIH